MKRFLMTNARPTGREPSDTTPSAVGTMALRRVSPSAQDSAGFVASQGRHDCSPIRRLATPPVRKTPHPRQLQLLKHAPSEAPSAQTALDSSPGKGTMIVALLVGWRRRRSGRRRTRDRANCRNVASEKKPQPQIYSDEVDDHLTAKFGRDGLCSTRAPRCCSGAGPEDAAPATAPAIETYGLLRRPAPRFHQVRSAPDGEDDCSPDSWASNWSGGERAGPEDAAPAAAPTVEACARLLIRPLRGPGEREEAAAPNLQRRGRCPLIRRRLVCTPRAPHAP